jgi:transporter family-2 protein
MVFARTLNGRLADLTNARISTFFNYVTGFLASSVVFLILGRSEPIFSGFTWSPNWYIYFGGTVGMIFVGICNVIVTKISSFSLSLFQFIGQVFAGIMIDWLISGVFSPAILLGGLLVAAGLTIDLVSGKKVYGQTGEN